MKLIIAPRQEMVRDSISIEGNGPSIETEHGWLMYYHGYNENLIYRLGVSLLDLNGPARVKNRPKE